MSPPLILLVDDNAELAELLAQIVEEAGYRTKVCHRGHPAIHQLDRERPALAVIDILLPDVVGYEVGTACQSRDIPFMFMTGVFKGGRHALDATRRRGARAFFEKPFDAEQLLEAIAKIVPASTPMPKAEEGLIIELNEEVAEGDYTPMAPIVMTGKVAVSGDTVTAFLSGQELHVRAPSSDNVYVRERPAPTKLERPPEAPPRLQRVEASSADGRTKRGELRDNLPALITAFALAKESGELGVQRGKVKKVIYFEKGLPVFAMSNLAADRFGSFLARVGKITKEQQQHAADRSSKEGRRTGDILIEMKLLHETEKLFYVAQQVKAIIYSLFGWEDGEYVLSFQDRARAEPLRLGTHPAHIIQRGIKKLYKPDRLERLVALEDRLIPSADPAFQLSEVELEAWEAEMLSRITGDRNVAELVAMASKPPHMVLASVATLLALRILEKRQ